MRQGRLVAQCINKDGPIGGISDVECLRVTVKIDADGAVGESHRPQVEAGNGEGLDLHGAAISDVDVPHSVDRHARRLLQVERRAVELEHVIGSDERAFERFAPALKRRSKPNCC